MIEEIEARQHILFSGVSRGSTIKAEHEAWERVAAAHFFTKLM